MTEVVVPFVGLAELTARQNLDAFIERAKQQRFFRGPESVNWAANSWDLRAFARTRGQNPSGYVVHFTTHETASRGKRSPQALDLLEPFLTAAKAVVVDYLVSAGMADTSKLTTILRMLERAFRELGQTPDLTALSPEVLDRTVEIVRASISDPWSYGRALERLVQNTVNPGRLAAVHLLWRSPFPYAGANRTDRVSTEAGEVEGAGKLPHLKCVLDLASVFRDATVPADVVTTAWFSLAMFSPSRVNEILTLPLACETEMDGAYGLSWRPLKGGDAMTKYATTDEWAEVARTAVNRLRELGAAARRAAKWYADHPRELYMPEGFEHLRGQSLTRWEVGQIIGRVTPITKGSQLDRAMRPTGETTTDLARSGGLAWTPLYEFTTIQGKVISLLPRDFPWADRRSGVLASDALFCLPHHVMRTDSHSLQNVPDLISAEQIYHD